MKTGNQQIHHGYSQTGFRTTMIGMLIEIKKSSILQASYALKRQWNN